jgi:DNA-binding transcriptional LysR family regulator
MKFEPLFIEKGLSLDRLAALVEVDDGGGIANAAPDDDSRQSLISRQLTELGRFFQTEIKCKTGKTVSLTPAGKELAKLAREHLQSLAEFQRTCRKQPAEIVIGAGDSLLQWLVLPRIRQVREALKGTIVELQDLQNLAICHQLRDQVIDFGLLRSDLISRGSIQGKSLGKFGYSLFIPEKLRPRDIKASEATLLEKFPLATQGGNTLFQCRLEELAASRGWQLNIQIRCESFPQVSQVLASGQMAAVLPDLARLSISLDSMWVCPLPSLKELQREVYLAWHPHRLETRPHLTGVKNKLAEVLKFELKVGCC